MKLILTTMFAAALSIGTWAQTNDTMFVHSRQGVYEFPANGVDSITFFRTKALVPVTSVTLSQTTVNVPAFDVVTLTATVEPPTASNKGVMWVSLTPELATVSNGVVTTLGQGVATVAAITEDGARVATCEITAGEPRMTGGGPYIVYRGDAATMITYDKNMKAYVKEFPEGRESIGEFTVYSHEGGYQFNVNLRNDIERPQAIYSVLPTKMLVLSDVHAKIVPFVQTLQGNGVIDENLEWTFGNGHLRVLGDIPDRGDDQTPLIWLLYKLQGEALAAGGNVHYTIGNHDVFTLNGDERYLNAKYLSYIDSLYSQVSGVSKYADFWKPGSSELGDWMVTRNTVEIMGPKLFVHAGMSPEVGATSLTVEEINNIVSNSITLPSSTSVSTDADLVRRDPTSVYWYREFVNNTASMQSVAVALDRWSPRDGGGSTQWLDQIIVGHTRVTTVESHYENQVICVDVSDNVIGNVAQGKSVGIIITPARTYAVSAKGAELPYTVLDPPAATSAKKSKKVKSNK